MVLFRSATGESWQEIMLDCSNQDYVLCDRMSDSYDKDPNAKCGNEIAYPYFISFYVLCSFLVSIMRILGRCLLNENHINRLSIYSSLLLWIILII